MTQPILSITESQASSESKTIVNLLPCRIDYDGPVNPVTPFWSPNVVEGKSIPTVIHRCIREPRENQDS